jgi:hypothetical protein
MESRECFAIVAFLDISKAVAPATFDSEHEFLSDFRREEIASGSNICTRPVESDIVASPSSLG